MPKIPVLVTGGAGYIGSHAVLALRDAGWSVSVIDNLSTGTRYLVPDDVTFVEGNVADRELVERIIAEQRIGAIMHFAGSIVVPESVEKPLDYYRNNTIASHALDLDRGRCGREAFRLFIDRRRLWRARARARRRERHPTTPINPYGASKLMTERMLEDSAAAYPINYAALRYFNVSGADPDGRSGQVGKGSTHLIKVAVEAAVGKRDHIDVYGTDYPTEDGSCVRDYIHVSDLVAAHLKALERLIEQPDQNLILNLGYGRGLSVLEVLDALDKVTGTTIRRELKGRRAGDPPLADLVEQGAAGNARLERALRRHRDDPDPCAGVGTQAADPELGVTLSRMPLLGACGAADRRGAAAGLGHAVRRPRPGACRIPCKRPARRPRHRVARPPDRRQLRRVGVSPARPEARRDQRRLVRRRAVPPSDLCRAAGDQPDRQWPQDRRP